MKRPLPFPLSAGSLPPRSSVLSFLRLLWAIDHGMQQRSKRMARDLGVTGLQRVVIAILFRYPRLTPGQLAALLHFHPSTVTGVVQRLQRHGYLLREVDPADRRRSRLALTARGRAVATPRAGTIEAELERALSRVAPQELLAAEKVLTFIGEQLSGLK